MLFSIRDNHKQFQSYYCHCYNSSMKVYHEVQPDSLGSILEDGLKRTTRGDKGDDSSIYHTDQLLDRLRPSTLTDAGVSRDNNLYGYLARDGHIIDITNGDLVPIPTFLNLSSQTVLELTIDPQRCYVSDLDRFDTVMRAIERHEADETIQALAHAYWQAVIPLADYSTNAFRRPEVMITYDVEPDDITPLSVDI